MSRRFAIISLLLGIALVAGSAATFVASSGPDDAGDATAIERAVRAAIVDAEEPSSAPVPVTSGNTASPAPSESSAPPEGGQAPSPTTVTPTSEPPAEYEPPSLVIEPGPAPVGLRIDALDVDAPITANGVNRRTGEMDVPDNVTDVGWYRFGASPGESGSSVLAAHVDLAGQGPGVFFNLRRIDPGALITVEMDDGTERYFRVRARATYDKDELPLDVIFAKEGPSILTLITCGGGFNRNIGSYDSNVVVYAVPVESPDDPGTDAT